MAAPSSGQLLRRYRALASLTQEELADRSGYSANYIGKLERDERTPPPTALDRLATTLQLGPAERARLRASRESPIEVGNPLVGRGREMAEIRGHLAGLGPPVLLFSGEPGIGKTRLLDEAAASAAAGGWRVVRGGCQRRAADLYAPISGAVADALRSLPAPDRQEVIRQAGPLELLLPELVLAGSQPGGGGETAGWSSVAVGSEQRRRLLVAAVENCLGAVAGQAGVVLVLDDLQWAGPDAFDLLQAVMPPGRSGSVRLIGAYRDSERPADARLREFVADMAREAQVQVMNLEPLSETEAERLVTERATEAIEDPAVVPAIVRRAGGVPFFLVSYLENLRRGEDGVPLLSLPWTVAQVIRQRVLFLPETTQELLRIAAIMGREVSHAALVRVADQSDEEVVGALETAVDARLLVEDEQPGYHFTHDLIRESIEGGLSAGRRRLLHRRIGEALEADPRSSAESLAFHFAQGGEDDRAITYLERAGDQAQRRVAHAAAASLFEQAIAWLERVGRRDDAVPIYEKLGLALYRAGRHDEAIAALDRALTGCRAAGDQVGVARVTLRLVDAHYRRGTSEDALDQVLNLAGGTHLEGPSAVTDDNQLRLAVLATLLFANPSGSRMVAVGRSLTRTGRTTRTKRLETLGMGLEGAGLINLGLLGSGAELIENIIPPHPNPEKDRPFADIAVILSCAYLAMGLLERTRAVSQRMLAAADLAGDESTAGLHTVVLACVDYVRGDWPSGRDLLRGPLESAISAGPSAVMARLTPVVSRCLLWSGNREVARPYLNTCLRTVRSMGVDSTQRSTLIDLADLDLLEGHSQVAISRVEPMIATEQSWDHGVLLFAVLAHAHFQLHQRQGAQQYAQQAVAEARRTAAWVNGLKALEICGLVEGRWGNPHRARALYGEGLQRARAMPFPYAEARLLHAYSVLDDQEGARASAEAKRSAALAIFETLGAPMPQDQPGV